MKIYNEKNVFDASMERIEFAFDNFDNLCVSYSGGKDSTVMIQLVEMIAKKKNKEICNESGHTFFVWLFTIPGVILYFLWERKYK